MTPISFLLIILPVNKYYFTNDSKKIKPINTYITKIYIAYIFLIEK